MKNFQQIAAGVDTLPLVHALKVNAHLWNTNTIRTEHPGTAHHEVDDVLLRFQEIGQDLAKAVEDLECVAYPAWFELPMARRIVLDLMHRVGGTRLGRVIVSRMAPGARILPHVDGGAGAAYYERYQVALQCLPGCVFRIGDEQMVFQAGDIWWIDNLVEHEVVNNSADDRIAMVVDIRVKD